MEALSNRELWHWPCITRVGFEVSRPSFAGGGKMKRFLASLAVLSLLTLSLPPRNAEGQAPPPPPAGSSTEQADPPSADAQAPGVARVSYVKGDVSSQRGDNS